MKKHKIIDKVNGLIQKIKPLAARCAAHIGLPFVYIGVILLAVFYFTGLTDYNWLTIIPPILILAGIIGFVRQQKRSSEY